MELRVTEYKSHSFAEACDHEPLDMRDVNDVLGFCFEQGSSRLLLHSDNLPPGFFDLSTGVAGHLLQKFRQYHIRLAVVWSPDKVKHTTRFAEMAAEENKGDHFRMYEDRDGALAWLVSDAT